MNSLENYAKEHWKSVVLCKECVKRKTDACPMHFETKDVMDRKYTFDFTTSNGYCDRGRNYGNSRN